MRVLTQMSHKDYNKQQAMMLRQNLRCGKNPESL